MSCEKSGVWQALARGLILRESYLWSSRILPCGARRQPRHESGETYTEGACSSEWSPWQVQAPWRVIYRTHPPKKHTIPKQITSEMSLFYDFLVGVHGKSPSKWPEIATGTIPMNKHLLSMSHQIGGRTHTKNWKKKQTKKRRVRLPFFLRVALRKRATENLTKPLFFELFKTFCLFECCRSERCMWLLASSFLFRSPIFFWIILKGNQKNGYS